jgi:hypothetical protein
MWVSQRYQRRTVVATLAAVAFVWSVGAASPQAQSPKKRAPEITAPTPSLYSVYYDFLYSNKVSPAARAALSPLYDAYLYLQQMMDAWKYYDLGQNIDAIATGLAGAKSAVISGSAKDPRVTIAKDPHTDDEPDTSAGQRVMTFQDLTNVIRAAEKQYNIDPVDSPLGKSFDLHVVDSQTLQQIVQDAAANAAKIITAQDAAMLTIQSPLDQIARAKASANQRAADSQDVRASISQSETDFAIAVSDQTAAQAQQRQSGTTARMLIPPDLLKRAIPPDWVPCTCPETHPNAGLLLNGQRWHTPSLTCDMPF